jgi:hypothetical protein
MSSKKRSRTNEQQEEWAPAPGHNARTLDVIGADLRKLRNVFDSGELLAEAKKQCRQTKTKWLPWLETYFDGDDQTARNHMKAYDLSLKFQSIRDLRVPASIIYRLTSLAADSSIVDKSELSAVIKALVEATQTESIGVAKADRVIRYVRLRHEHGDYPDATLDALENLYNLAEHVTKKAYKALKKDRPETKEGAEVIVNAHYHAHLNDIYGGALPDWLDRGMLERLDDDDLTEPMRARVLKELQAAPQPLTMAKVASLVFKANADLEESVDPDEQQDESEQEPPDTPSHMLPAPGDPSGEILPTALEPETKETDQEQAAAAADAAGDVGGKAEIERLTVVVEALQNDKTRLERAKAANEREIERLEAEIKANTPKLSIEKLIAALVVLLKPVSREKGREVVGTLCVKLGIDPHKLSIEDKEKAA